MDDRLSHVGTYLTTGRLTCLNLIHAYNNSIDTGHAERVADLFTDHVVLDLGVTLTRVDAIR
jgi:hypothetical protein